MEHIKESLKNLGLNLSNPASTNPITEEYTCPICRDAGFVHPRDGQGKVLYDQAVPCVCRQAEAEKAKMKRILKFCRLPGGTAGWTFDNFDAYTPDLKKALAAARDIASPDGKIRWLILMSKVDRGKSHLAVAICREWLKRGVPARYVFVPDLLDELRDGYEHQGADSFMARMHVYKTVPLLVMDDLGTEKVTEWAIEKITSIINTRTENDLHLVVTTNRPLDEIPGDDYHRIGSRLYRREGRRLITIEDAGEYVKHPKKGKG